MENNSGRATWDKSYKHEPMRMPHARSDPSKSISTQQSRPTVLSPNAPEFIPKSFIRNKITSCDGGQGQVPAIETISNDISNIKIHSVQNRLNATHNRGHVGPPGRFTHSMQGRQNITHSVQDRLNRLPRSDIYGPNASSSNFEPNQGLSSELSEEESFALEYIAQIVECLNDDPGRLETFEHHLLKVFEGFKDNQFVLSNAMETIFMQSIKEQNFRYMGAKLYRLLDSINPRENSAFRILLNLKLTYHQNEVLNYMQSEQHLVRGTALFLAELYMQLRYEEYRIKDIALHIIFTMNQLLQKTTPENIKCICLTLKLAGYELEMDFPAEIAAIIEQLRSILDSIDVGTSRVLETVLALQKNNWGRNTSISQVTPSTEVENTFTDQPVFYGPDGKVMTEEENSFLESYMQYNENDDNDSDESEIDPDMDPEIKTAYKDFLKNSVNNTC